LLPGLGQIAPAQSQPAPPADPLPAVVYPFAVPDTAPPVTVLPGSAADAPAPIRYVLVDGVWGYWDRAHRFHPRPVPVTQGLERPPGGAVRIDDAGRTAGLPPVSHGETSRAEIRRPPPRAVAPRIAAALPNPRPGGIVVHSTMPRDRDQMR
jgi:hypothetical protein